MKKQMKKGLAKGFTLTELVIVIVIIAILAAVLIPTYTGLVTKAKDSNDTSLVKMLNDAMMDSEFNDEYKHDTFYDVVDSLEDYGFKLAALQAKSSKNVLVWNQVTNRFYILNNEDFTIDTRDSNPDPNDVDYNDGKLIDAKYTFWVIYNSDNKVVKKVENAIVSDYSVYLAADIDGAITTDKGIDVGDNDGITSITYSNSGSCQDVVIRSNSFDTLIELAPYVDPYDNTKGDHVELYGSHATVSGPDGGKAVVANNSLVVNDGIVGRALVESGHVVADGAGTAICALVGNAIPDANNGAVIYGSDGEEATTKEAMVNVTVNDCGKGNHSQIVEMVIDNHVYEVCKKCGYTLVHVTDDETGKDETTTKVDGSNAIVTTPVETYSEGALNADNKILEDETPTIATPAVDNTNGDTTCDHNWNTTTVDATCTVDGSITKVCTKCGMTLVSVIPATGHNPSANYSYNSTHHWKTCTNNGCTAEIGKAEHNIAENSENGLCQDCHNYFVHNASMFRKAISDFGNCSNPESQVIFLTDGFDVGSNIETAGVGDQARKCSIAISKSLSIDGNGNTINATASDRTVLGLYGSNDKIDVKISNLKISSSTSWFGIETRDGINSLSLNNVTITCADSNTSNTASIQLSGATTTEKMSLNLTDCTLNDSTYGIMFWRPVDLVLDNTSIHGWSCLYFKGPYDSAITSGSTIVIRNNSIIDSSNPHSGNSNSFGAIVLEDNNIHTTLENSTFNISSTGDQFQTLILNSSYIIDFDNTSTALFKEGTKVTLFGNEVSLAVDAPITLEEDCYLYTIDNIHYEVKRCAHENIVTADYLAPTCTEEGHQAGTWCEECHKIYSGCETIAATGHDFNEDGTCKNCTAAHQYTQSVVDSKDSNVTWTIVWVIDSVQGTIDFTSISNGINTVLNDNLVAYPISNFSIDVWEDIDNPSLDVVLSFSSDFTSITSAVAYTE